MFNGGGVVHGGLLASVAGETAWYAIKAGLPERTRMSTSGLQIDYLRPVQGPEADREGNRARVRDDAVRGKGRDF